MAARARNTVTEENVEQAAEEAVENLNDAVVTLEWGGETWTIPKRRGRWSTRAAREFGRDNYVEAIVALVGEEGWQRVEAVCPYVDDLNAFADYAGARINAECIP